MLNNTARTFFIGFVSTALAVFVTAMATSVSPALAISPLAAIAAVSAP